MERSRNILRKIASASQRVITAANEYADHRNLFNVERAHFQLEEEMQKISVACECLATVLPVLLPSHSPTVDERIKDWLASDEPRMCFETLDQMEKLLQEDTSSPTPSSLTVKGTTSGKDGIKKAVSLFNSQKRCYHFLFSVDVWNNESSVQEQKHLYRSRDHGTKILEPRSRTPVQTELHAIVPEIVVDDGRNQGEELITKPDERKREDVNKLMELFKWLDGLNCAEKQDVTLSLRQPDTCKWLFGMTQYRMWRDGASSFLWLRGKAGAGKSVLASSVINSLEESQRDGEYLAYFYCDFRNERSTLATEVMRSILSQVLRQANASGVDLRSCVSDLMKARERGGATLNNAKQLARFVTNIAGLLVQKPLVIIDALDECKDFRELLSALEITNGLIQLFVTSRPLHAVMGSLSGLPFISLDDAVNELSADIDLHVTRELDARQRLRDLDTAFKTEIRSVLCKRADGMFRWVQCSIDALNRCVTWKEVRDALSSLPEGLDETYERILLAIDANALEGQLTRRALIWLVAALRPLHLDELMEGLSINLHKRTLDSDLRPIHNGALLDACGSLVAYIERTGIITLSHFSVKEYLTGELVRSKLFQYHVNWELAHLHLARSCMCYISICLQNTLSLCRSHNAPAHTPRAFPEYNEHLWTMSQPLRDYVLDHGPEHFYHLGPQFESILDDIRTLEVATRSHHRMWDNMCMSANRIVHYATPSWPMSRHDFVLYILVAFCPDTALRTFLRHTALKPKEGTNPLIYAAHFNKHEHVQALLSRGARLNQRGWRVDGFCQVFPIEIALRNRHYDVVTLFVAEAGPIPIHTSMMLYQCCAYRKISSSIVKVLLQTEGFAEAVQSTLMGGFSSPLASFYYLLDDSIGEQDLIVILRRIMQVGYSPLGATPYRDALIRIVVQQGHVAVASYLLSLGMSLPSDLLVTSGLEHLRNGAQMLCFLIKSGANTAAHSSNGDSVLHIMLRAFDEHDALEAAKLLVACGCDNLEADSRGKNTFQIATERGHVSVARYLLSLAPPLPPNLLATLHLQSMKNGAQMVLFLVESGANPTTHTSNGDSLLHIAVATFVEQDALKVTKLLVARGCNHFEVGSRGKTPLQVAIERGHVSVSRYLLSLCVPLSSDLLDTLHLRGMDNGAQMIQFLVENGAHATTCSRGKDSLLHIILATFDENDALDMAKLLVAHGYDHFEVGSRGKTPLQIAAEQGHVSVVRYLLSLGTPLSSNILDILDLKLMCNGAQMIRLLVENGAHATGGSSNGGSVLHSTLHAVFFDEHNALETTKFLVSHGCDHLKADLHGETPLQIAAKRGFVSVVRYLFSLRLDPPLSSDLSDILDFQGMQNGAKTSNSDSVLYNVLTNLVEHDALKAAQLVIAHACNPLQTNSCGETPLQAAVKRGHVSVARYLLSCGVPLSSDLVVALMRSYASTFRCFANHGAEILDHTDNGDSMFHVVLRGADKHEALESTKSLVGYGCDPLHPDSRGKTALHIAIEQGHVSIVRYLLSLGVTLPPDSLPTTSNPWNSQKDAQMIYCLVENGADVLACTRSGNSVLHLVLEVFEEDGALEMTEFLVRHGCDAFQANRRGKTPLRIAIERGHVFVARYLLSIGATLPSASDLLVTLGDLRYMWMAPRMIRFLIESGANTLARTRSGKSILRIVMEDFGEDDVLETIKVLVAHGCDPLQVDPCGETPIHIAIQRGHIFVALYLLSLGATLPFNALFIALNSPKLKGESWRKWAVVHFLFDQGVSALATTSNNDSVLHVVIANPPFDDALDALTSFIARGCDPAMSNAHGVTPFHVAVERGNSRIVKHLLSLNVPPPPDILFTAIESNLISDLQAKEVVEVLVTSGCDTQTRSKSDGPTPLRAAIIRGYVAVVEYLLTVADGPPPEDLLSDIAFAPPRMRNEITSMLNRRRARSESPDGPDHLPAKRTRYS